MPSHQCRLVHSVTDQCAFVRAHCPDEEAGLLSYLQLYYCTLTNIKALAFAILVLWLALLFTTIGIAASDFFCINLNTIATLLGMSESMAGVTFLAFGNGSPDVFSTFAAMRTNSGSLAVGELIGAAGFITTVVAGSMALVRPFKVARKSFIRDVGFFIVAIGFSMGFLADGHLHLWECAVMVAFYVFYVFTVVTWHWYLGRQKRRSTRETVARGHFMVPEEEQVAMEIEEDGDVASANRSRAISRITTTDDFAILERNARPLDPGMDDEDDDTRDRWIAEINRNMRITRPVSGERRNTGNPIRPSLVGALEFRAVLSSLHKSRNHENIPINLRRYSDDPTFTLSQQHNLLNEPHPGNNQSVNDVRRTEGPKAAWPSTEGDRSQNRVRAVSANDAAHLSLVSNGLQIRAIPEIDLLGPTPPASACFQSPDTNREGAWVPLSTRLKEPLSPSVLISPPHDTIPPSPAAVQTKHLVPPQDGYYSSAGDVKPIKDPERSTSSDSHALSRPSLSQLSPNPSFLLSPGTAYSSPAMPFPQYFDEPDSISSLSRPSSIRLPPPSLDSESTFRRQIQEHASKPLPWWPYNVLPSPEILGFTLFPTLYSWNDKSIGERLLGIAATPSVFVLAITLPVVEADSEDNRPPDNGQHSMIPASDDYFAGSNHGTNPLILVDSVTADGLEENEAAPDEPMGTIHQYDGSSVQMSKIDDRTQAVESTQSIPLSSKGWNRWLLCTQIFTAPLFIVFVIWANSDTDLSIRNLLFLELYTLTGSLALLAIVLLTTSEGDPPRYRFLVCFLGFVVSIAWISTIANEVVGVLKAFGVILGISDAILGLTVFAVGNSLGDLVADITVARLGYPVMALSACFGGPMLNILLGIGLGGLYMTIRDGNGRHDKHPGRPIKYKPYQIEVGGTLIISGVTLLITLVGLLTAVPLNKWVMDKRIGWGLVALWCISTFGNVVMEITGWSGHMG